MARNMVRLGTSINWILFYSHWHETDRETHGIVTTHHRSIGWIGWIPGPRTMRFSTWINGYKWYVITPYYTSFTMVFTIKYRTIYIGKTSHLSSENWVQYTPNLWQLRIWLMGTMTMSLQMLGGTQFHTNPYLSCHFNWQKYKCTSICL